jgi:eukaryotic-like serine/threonine-protein kinase
MSVLADRYELAEPLGVGGMARVVVAHDRLLNRRVAVKLIRDELVGDEASRRRLLREARAAAALHHPNTVAVFDVGQDEQPFIVMELVEGETLADRLARQGPLGVDETLGIAVAVLDGLAAAHDRGLVHRDVKPSNILLPRAGGVKLADFGIAKELSGATDVTATGRVLGTPRYLSPEQAAGAAAGPASDLYALGAVLYECLAGRAPFEAESPLAVALAHQQQPAPPLADRVPGLPPALGAVIERALAKRPEDRHADARTMRAALLRAAGDGTAVLPSSAAGDEHDDAFESGPAGAFDEVEGGTTPRGRWLAAVLTPLALLVLAVVLLPGGDDDVTASPDGAEGPAEETAIDAEGGGSPGGGSPGGGSTEDEPIGEEAPTAPEPDLGDLVADLARDPGAAGEKSDDLLDDLLELRGEDDPEKRAEQARELIVEIGGWLADNDLDAAVGGQALDLLEDEARPAAAVLHAPTALLVDVARDKGAWGERADDLLDDLEGLLDEDDPEDRSEDAEKLVRDVEKWIEQERLEAERGRQAIEVLRAVTADR